MRELKTCQPGRYGKESLGRAPHTGTDTHTRQTAAPHSQEAEIPAKKLKRGHTKKISGRILADFYQKHTVLNYCRWTQKWPSKITCGLGNQRPRKRPNFLIAAWYEQKLAKIAQEQSLAERERRLMKPKFWITSSRNLTCMVIVRQSWQYQVLKPTKEEMPYNVMYCFFYRINEKCSF